MARTRTRDVEEIRESFEAALGVKTGLCPGIKVGVSEATGEVAGVISVGLDSAGASAGAVDSGEEAPGEGAGPNARGPGDGRGAPEALHWRGTPPILQARGNEIESVRLMGNCNGTPAVTKRQAQPMLPLTSERRELQQSAVGEAPLPPVLPVI